MKTVKKLLVLLLTALILCSSILTATASVIPPVTETYAGETVSIDFSYDNIAGIHGTFTTAGDDIIESVEIVPDGGFAGTQKNNVIAFFADSSKKFVAQIKIVVKDTAKKGDECKVTFKYETTENGKMPTEPKYEYEEATIKIVLDYTELDKQLDDAKTYEGKEDKYTADSWDAFIKAWDAAKKARNEAKTQAEVDAAAKALKDAIAGLKEKTVTPPVTVLDYTELDEQLRRAEGLVEDEYTSESWAKMKEAWDAAIKARAEATTQAEIDAAAKALKEAIDALVKKTVDPTPDEPTPDQPTPDEPTPDEPEVEPEDEPEDKPEAEEPDKNAPDSPTTEGVMMLIPMLLIVAALVVLFVYVSKKKISDI